MDKDKIINKIEQIMSHRKINQTKLAELAGLTNRSVGRWLSGEIIPSENSLKKIANAHNISLRWLCDENYKGPMNADAEWAYDARQISFTHLEAAQIYERIKELMSARDLNPAKLVAISGINVTMEKEPCFLGALPRPRDIEKISKATGYNKDWIWYGHAPRLEDKYTKEKHVHQGVAQPEAGYDKHGGGGGRFSDEEQEIFKKVAYILGSESLYSDALIQNIEAFYHAVRVGEGNPQGKSHHKLKKEA